MNDRFKYRVWDKESSKMLYPVGDEESIEFDGNGDFVGIDKIGYWNGGLNCEIMQSTGLKDKNGKLIYEGDVIKTEAQAGIVINYGIVGFNEKEARFLMTANLKSQDYIYSFWYRNSLEVIGNVYENKDLLNENR